VLLAPCPPPAKEGNRGLGELFVLFCPPAKGVKFLLAQRPPPAKGEQRGRGLVRKTFFCFVNGNIFLFSTPKRKHISLFHTYFYSFQLVISSLTPVDHLNFTLTQVPQHGSTIKEEEIKQQTGRV
jgi:hypothetical protein